MMDECELCGEGPDPLDPMTEFFDPAWPGDPDTRVIAHAQCGLDQHLEMA